jgi:site-specific recombinase XerD
MKTPEASNLVGPLLQLFFAEHLVVHKRASAQTIASYRDTFRLLLQFMRDETGIAPSALSLAALNADAVLEFLDHIERDRGCTVRSRNNRLAAIRSFFRFVSLRDPAAVGIVTRIMAIPTKRYERKLVGHLNRDEVKALLAAPDRTTWSGRRDRALLLTLYNTGARISEIITLRRGQVRLDPFAANIELLGKGRKERVIPLWDDTARVLRAWFRELGDDPDGVVFPSSQGRPLSRDGVDYLLRRALVGATASCPSLGTKSVSPHILRHSTAMHLLQSRCRPRGNCIVAWSRKHRDDERLYRSGPGNKGASASKARPHTKPPFSVSSLRQAFGLSSHPVIMPI